MSRSPKRVRQAAILTDTTKCIGCYACVEACSKANHTGKAQPWPWRSRDGLSAEVWTTVVRRPGQKYVRKQCRHCLEPSCVSVCPVGALTRNSQGAVVYDSKICLGCRYCMMACPYGIPRFLWQSAIPYVRKCTFCAERIDQGKDPACTTACPTGCTIFGERKALLAEARQRLRKSPKKYKPRIWGEHEVAGTSVLYLSDVDLTFLNVSGRPLGREPMPEKTGWVLRKVPAVFAGVVTGMFGIWWIIERRRHREAERAAETPAPDAPGDRKDGDE